MANVKIVKSIYTGENVTALGEVAAADLPQVDHIEEITAAHGVVIDGVQLKDGGALAIVGGTNTFNITNGTASLDVAAGKAVNIDQNLTVQGVTNIVGELDIAIGTTTNIDANVTVSAELHVEAATHVNQDLTTDASPTFDHLHLGVATNIFFTTYYCASLADEASVNIMTLNANADLFAGIFLLTFNDNSSNRRGGLFNCAGGAVVLISDLATGGIFSVSDADNKLCVFYTSPNLVIKNRMGATYTVFELTWIGRIA
jgi:hypothetical protein